MATIAAQITELEAELVAVKAAMVTTMAAGQSFTTDGLSRSAVSYPALKQRRKEIEKSLQRLYRGGRGVLVNLSYGVTGQASEDPYRSGSEVLL